MTRRVFCRLRRVVTAARAVPVPFDELITEKNDKGEIENSEDGNGKVSADASLFTRLEDYSESGAEGHAGRGVSSEKGKGDNI